MKLLELWQSLLNIVKRENPITSKFMLWYIIAVVVTIVIIVASKVLPMIQETIQLNEEIQQGKYYIEGQNPIFNPNIEDFILQNDGTFQMKKLYPAREPQDKWEADELNKYWDNIDQKTLKELRQENRKMLKQQLQNLP